jgi:uncharacterized protein (DUF1501 family)
MTDRATGRVPPGHVCMADNFHLGRRGLLLGLGASLAVGRPAAALAGTAGIPRLVVINTRGGLDGLSLVAPYGDRNLAPLRAQIMAPAVGTPGGMFDLGGFFGLHPAMPNLYAMYQAGQAAMVHAVGNILITRSHFDGQDCLQSGAPELLTSGWLNRAMSAVPAAAGMESVISMASCQPLITQGANVTAGWSPGSLGTSSAQFVSSLTQLLQTDPLLGPAYRDGYQDRAVFNALLKTAPLPAGLSGLQELAWAAGDFLASSSGPSIAAIQTDSFDTHCYQVSRMNTGLANLDGALLCLKTALGAAWANTVVMTLTEFGRTAAANGNASCGTDHGTAFAVILAGGAVAGGRVIASWPGLAAGQLYQGRDLAPTVDVRSIAAGILQQHMGMPAAAVQSIFPGDAVAPMNGLVTS